MTTIFFRPFSETIKSTAPTRAHDDDAGWDLYVSRRAYIPPNSFVDVHTDIAVELPKAWWGLLTGRSSTLRNRGLLVNQAVIDTGYRGELFAGVWNLTNETVTVEPGDRLAQLILIPMAATQQMFKVTELANHPRGLNGFGSSGA